METLADIRKFSIDRHIKSSNIGMKYFLISQCFHQKPFSQSYFYILKDHF